MTTSPSRIGAQLYSPVERELLRRLGRKRRVYVAVADRAEVLRDLAKRGYCRVYPGEGREEGLLIGEATPAGLDACKLIDAGIVA